MAGVEDVENCYRYILGREMSEDERHGIDGAVVTNRDLGELRQQFLKSPEFHNAHLETLFENLVPKSIPVLYETNLGFKIYLDLRQLHISFGVLNESYDRAEVELIRKIVPDNGTFIDVGANCGYYSLAVAAKENFSGKIISFEPLPPLWDLFERSVAVNGWLDKIEVRKIALAHAAGALPLTDAEFGINAGATRLAIGLPDRESQRTVTVDTLDNVAADIRADVVKIDIEGAEGLFFHGARKTLQRDKPTLLFEMNPELLRMVSHLSPGDLQNWLQAFQYRLWSVETEGLHPVSINRSVGEMIGQRGMQNFVAIHVEKIPSLCDRIGDVLMLDEQAA